MTIQFSCCGCGRAINVPDDSVGRRLKCKRCDQMLIVPNVPMLTTTIPMPKVCQPVTELPMPTLRISSTPIVRGMSILKMSALIICGCLCVGAGLVAVAMKAIERGREERAAAIESVKKAEVAEAIAEAAEAAEDKRRAEAKALEAAGRERIEYDNDTAIYADVQEGKYNITHVTIALAEIIAVVKRDEGSFGVSSMQEIRATVREQYVSESELKAAWACFRVSRR